MKKILIMCGTGVATTTVVKNKVENFLQKTDLDQHVQIIQSQVSQEVNRLKNYDLVLSTTMVSEELKEHVINAVPILTGIGAEEVFDYIQKRVQEF